MCLKACLKHMISQKCVFWSKRRGWKSGHFYYQFRVFLIRSPAKVRCDRCWKEHLEGAVTVPEQDLQTKFGGGWKEEHNCVRAEVSPYSSVSELHSLGRFAGEMWIHWDIDELVANTECMKLFWPMKAFVCHHPPRSVWLPTFYWKL